MNHRFCTLTMRAWRAETARSSRQRSLSGARPMVKGVRESAQTRVPPGGDLTRSVGGESGCDIGVPYCGSIGEDENRRAVEATPKAGCPLRDLDHDDGRIVRTPGVIRHGDELVRDCLKIG